MKYRDLLFLQHVMGLSYVRGNHQVPLLPLSVPSVEHAPSSSIAVGNAPYIFNTIHGALRQWDNSLKHNGMSYYPATVAANTLLYHGDQYHRPLNKTDWLAFEVEHSELFYEIAPSELRDDTVRYLGHIDERNFTGYLSTYYTTRPLNVMYIDGMSAAKSSHGTLDTQDRVILQDGEFKKLPGFQDRNRVEEICRLLPRVDGIIRMELGFELLLCDVGKNLKLLSTTSHPRIFYQNKTENVFWRSEYMRGITKGYFGLGATKVVVDFSSMISAYFYPLNLTNPDPKKAGLPRINPDEKEKIRRLRNDVANLFESKSSPQESIGWQGIVDEIINRYSDRLAYIESKKSNKYEMIHETKFLLERFINRTALNMTASKEHCASLYLVPAKLAPTFSSSDKFIYEAVMTVSREICNVLFEVHEMLISQQDSAGIEEAKSLVRDLMKWLDWSRWKECGRCDWNEVCFIPIWPWGTQEDYDHPRCREINHWWPSLDYWDMDLGETS